MKYFWIYVFGFFFVQAAANLFAIEWLQHTLDSVDQTLAFAGAIILLYKETRPNSR